MKKPNKTAAELEALIRVEVEGISDLPTDIAIAVRPDGSTKPACAHAGRSVEALRNFDPCLSPQLQIFCGS